MVLTKRRVVLTKEQSVSAKGLGDLPKRQVLLLKEAMEETKGLPSQREGLGPQTKGHWVGGKHRVHTEVQWVGGMRPEV